MIAVEFSGFVFAILLAALLFLGGLWVGGETLRHWREHRRRRQQLFCPLCGLEFYDESPRSLVKCPLCDGDVHRRAAEPSRL